MEADDHDANDDMDAPEDPPIIDISSDDEDDGEEPEYEPGYEGWLDNGDEFEDDPEEILFDDGDWDADSNASSVVTIELVQMYDGKVVDTSILVLTMYVKYDVNEVPPPVHQVPPVVPPVPEVQPEVQPEVPIAPAGVQINPLLVNEDLLYERFRRMKAPEFEGPTDPIAVDKWLIDIQVILDFMRLTEQEKVLCASFALKKDARHWWMTVQMRRDVTTMNWQDFVTEFRTMYYNMEVLAAQQDEFTNLKQGSMTVMEAVKKFEQLARLCPGLVPSETEKVRRMMKMFRTDISKQVSAGSSPPTLVSDCVSRAIRAEYWINQDKEARAQIFKARKEEKAVVNRFSPVRVRNHFQKVRTITLPRVPNSLEGTREKGISRASDNNKGTTLRRGIIKETRVTTPTSRCARNVEGNIREYVEWGRTLATFVARRGIMQEIAL
ncbi:hypothetical protein TIFTF001_034239 [Ficus carica]|uniref:Retrotransposon gag domain-containing protein n=1 Tax=Ficus carica TaxID=3494 RepID=A0AA88JAD3_FICCA|nr:hypothetical protein TIFTF001_034239 [Ficus carica]